METDYENVEELEIVTLENAVYLGNRKMIWLMYSMMNCFSMNSSPVRIKYAFYAVFFMSVTVIPEWSEMRIFTEQADPDPGTDLCCFL